MASLGIDPETDLWVFAYGSLMWEPGFAHAERRDAVLPGYHRRFCIYSHCYRGTPRQPGLVLGLDAGGECRGMAYRVTPGDLPAAVAYLWQREMITRVYRPAMLPLHLLDDGGRVAETVTAWAFVADQTHDQYCAETDPDRLARMIVDGRGSKGPNRDYLEATVTQLDRIGVPDPDLRDLLARVDRMMAVG